AAAGGGVGRAGSGGSEPLSDRVAGASENPPAGSGDRERAGQAPGTVQEEPQRPGGPAGARRSGARGFGKRKSAPSHPAGGGVESHSGGDLRRPAPRLRHAPPRGNFLMPPDPAPLLEVENLRVEFDTPEGKARAVNGVSFQIRESETLGLVGESGCGKSLTAMSVLRLISPPGRIATGRILLRGRDLLTVSEPEIRQVRW